MNLDTANKPWNGKKNFFLYKQMDSPYVLYGLGIVALLFFILFLVYLSKYNTEKDEQNCTLGSLSTSTVLTSKTLTAAQIVQANIVGLVAIGAPITLTTPTAADIITRIGTVAAKTCLPLVVQIANASGSVITLAAGANVTISGTATVAANTTSTFSISAPTSTTVTFTLVGNGANSNLA